MSRFLLRRCPTKRSSSLFQCRASCSQSCPNVPNATDSISMPGGHVPAFVGVAERVDSTLGKSSLSSRNQSVGPQTHAGIDSCQSGAGVDRSSTAALQAANVAASAGRNGPWSGCAVAGPLYAAATAALPQVSLADARRDSVPAPRASAASRWLTGDAVDATLAGENTEVETCSKLWSTLPARCRRCAQP